jgi:hypothetical protein
MLVSDGINGAWVSHAIPRYLRAEDRITTAEVRVLSWRRMNTMSCRWRASAPTSVALTNHIVHDRLLMPAEQCSRAR